VASEAEMVIKRFKIGDLFRASDLAENKQVMFIHEVTMGLIGFIARLTGGNRRCFVSLALFLKTLEHGAVSV